MVKHIILWQLKEMDEEEKQTVKKGIKAGLESLQGKIPGLLSIHVQTEGLPSSNADIMLDSSFENVIVFAGATLGGFLLTTHVPVGGALIAVLFLTVSGLKRWMTNRVN